MGCRGSFPKGELLRLVLAPGADVRLDPEGLTQARGAYVCRRAECAARAVDWGLARSFRTPVKASQETIDSIQEWQRSASTR